MTCWRPFRKLLFACVLAALAVSYAAPAGAEIISVNLTLDAPAAPVNTLNVSIALDMTAGPSASDSRTTTAGGNLLADLHATFDPMQVATVTGLEFTGGTMAFTDMSFLLDFGPLGTVPTSSSNVQATADTPTPPGSVTGTTFPVLEHRVIFNAGTVDFVPSGPIASYLPPFTYDLSTHPLVVAHNATGTLTVSTPDIDFPNATYDVFLSIPLDFTAIVVESSDASATLDGAGTIQASGQFTRVIPEPASGVLLVLGSVAALRRRRRR